jgi:hypothetical protein
MAARLARGGLFGAALDATVLVFLIAYRWFS